MSSSGVPPVQFCCVQGMLEAGWGQGEAALHLYTTQTTVSGLQRGEGSAVGLPV